MRRLWCRLAGHRWGPAVYLWEATRRCRRCQQTHTSSSGGVR
jgi:hypothetical protein